MAVAVDVIQVVLAHVNNPACGAATHCVQTYVTRDAPTIALRDAMIHAMEDVKGRQREIVTLVRVNARARVKAVVLVHVQGSAQRVVATTVVPDVLGLVKVLVLAVVPAVLGLVRVRVQAIALAAPGLAPARVQAHAAGVVEVVTALVLGLVWAHA